MLVQIINILLSRIKSRFALVNIEKIQVVCDHCEATDINLTVTGDREGNIVIFTPVCQKCSTTHCSNVRSEL